MTSARQSNRLRALGVIERRVKQSDTIESLSSSKEVFHLKKNSYEIHPSN